jgi:Tfp pilus assembly protein PilF
MLGDSAHPALPTSIDHFGLGHLAEQRGQLALAREHLTQALRQDATLAAPVNALFVRRFWGKDAGQSQGAADRVPNRISQPVTV